MKQIFDRSIAEEHYGRVREILREALASARPDDLLANAQELRAMASVFGGASLASAAVAATAYLARGVGGLTGDLVQSAGMLADYVGPAAAVGWAGMHAWMSGQRNLLELRERQRDADGLLRALVHEFNRTQSAERAVGLLPRVREALELEGGREPVVACQLLLEVARKLGEETALTLSERIPASAAHEQFIRATVIGLRERAGADVEHVSGPGVG